MVGRRSGRPPRAAATSCPRRARRPRSAPPRRVMTGSAGSEVPPRIAESASTSASSDGPKSIGERVGLDRRGEAEDHIVREFRPHCRRAPLTATSTVLAWSARTSSIVFGPAVRPRRLIRFDRSVAVCRYGSENASRREAQQGPEGAGVRRGRCRLEAGAVGSDRSAPLHAARPRTTSPQARVRRSIRLSFEGGVGEQNGLRAGAPVPPVHGSALPPTSALYSGSSFRLRKYQLWSLASDSLSCGLVAR